MKMLSTKMRGIVVAALCGVILLGGCQKAETGSEEASRGDVTLEEVQRSEEGSKKESADLGEDGEGLEQNNGNAGEDAVVIETGPQKPLYEAGNLAYTLYGFKLYNSPEEAGIEKNELETADAEYYMDRSKFLTFKVDINNIDYPGDEKDGEGELNLSLFVISPKEPDESLQWAGSYPVYLSEHGEKEKFYHVWVKPGETRTVLIGFYVPVEDIEELCSQCKITLYGLYDEGYVYDIPKVQ